MLIVKYTATANSGDPLSLLTPRHILRIIPFYQSIAPHVLLFILLL